MVRGGPWGHAEQHRYTDRLDARGVHGPDLLGAGGRRARRATRLCPRHAWQRRERKHGSSQRSGRSSPGSGARPRGDRILRRRRPLVGTHGWAQAGKSPPVRCTAPTTSTRIRPRSSGARHHLQALRGPFELVCSITIAEDVSAEGCNRPTVCQKAPIGPLLAHA
jgi:hypothetical protein